MTKIEDIPEKISGIRVNIGQKEDEVDIIHVNIPLLVAGFHEENGTNNRRGYLRLISTIGKLPANWRTLFFIQHVSEVDDLKLIIGRDHLTDNSSLSDAFYMAKTVASGHGLRLNLRNPGLSNVKSITICNERRCLRFRPFDEIMEGLGLYQPANKPNIKQAPLLIIPRILPWFRR